MIAAAGNLDHAAVVTAGPGGVRRHAARLGPAEPRRAAPGDHRVPAQPPAQRSCATRTPSRRTWCSAAPASPGSDERRFALGVLNNVLGGGMSSRLFQEIREKRGLAYSVYSYTSQYADAGLFGVYAGCAPGKVDEVLALTRDELARVAADGLTDDEVARGKGMLKGSLVLGLEDTGSRMSRLGKGELLYGELLDRRRAAAPGRRGHPGGGPPGRGGSCSSRPMSLA